MTIFYFDFIEMIGRTTWRDGTKLNSWAKS